MNRVPIDLVDTYIHLKRWKKGKGNLMTASMLKEILFRVKFCKLGVGGNKRGIRKEFYYEYLKDLIEWEILKKIDRARYILLNNSNCEKRIRYANYP